MEHTRVISWPQRRQMEGRPSTIRAPSEAECRVLELVALGLSSAKIAERLSVSRQAVTYHIGNLFKKLDADSRAGLVARAYASGLIMPESWPPEVSRGLRQVVHVVRAVGADQVRAT